jgi:hypothetical protein
MKSEHDLYKEADRIETENRGFQFQKRSQLFIRAHDEPLSVVAMSVCNPDW